MSEEICDPDTMKTTDDEESPPSTSAREDEFSSTPLDEHRPPRIASDDLTPSLAGTPSASSSVEQSVETEPNSAPVLPREEPLEPAVTVPSQRPPRSEERVVTQGCEAELLSSGSGGLGESLDSGSRAKRTRTSYVAPPDSGLTLKFGVWLHGQEIFLHTSSVSSQEVSSEFAPQPKVGLRPPSDEQSRESAPQSRGDEHRQPESMDIDDTVAVRQRKRPHEPRERSRSSDPDVTREQNYIVMLETLRRYFSVGRSDREKEEHEKRRKFKKALKRAQRAQTTPVRPLESDSLQIPEEAFKGVTVSDISVELNPDLALGSSTTATTSPSDSAGDARSSVGSVPGSSADSPDESARRIVEQKSSSEAVLPRAAKRYAEEMLPERDSSRSMMKGPHIAEPKRRKLHGKKTVTFALSDAVPSSSKSLPVERTVEPQAPTSREALAEKLFEKILKDILKTVAAHLQSEFASGLMPEEIDSLSTLQGYRSSDDNDESNESSSESSASSSESSSSSSESSSSSSESSSSSSSDDKMISPRGTDADDKVESESTSESQSKS